VVFGGYGRHGRMVASRHRGEVGFRKAPPAGTMLSCLCTLGRSRARRSGEECAYAVIPAGRLQRPL